MNRMGSSQVAILLRVDGVRVGSKCHANHQPSCFRSTWVFVDPGLDSLGHAYQCELIPFVCSLHLLYEKTVGMFQLGWVCQQAVDNAHTY
jgi:hypothetical protein